MTERVLLITGASSGIGAATARAAAQAGYRLALAARSEDKLAALVEEIGADRALALRCDVAELTDQEAMVAGARDRFGRIDAVFANAGMIGVPGGITGGDPDYWRRMILTNVWGVAATVRLTADALKESRGHVVITGSVAGRRTLAGSMYGVTKWAVNALGWNLREELSGTGVRVTVLEPGRVDTPFFDEPQENALTAEDVARAVLYALEQPAHVDVHELLVLPTPPME